MAFTEHIFPNINNIACGVVKCYLYTDNSISLTYPTAINIVNSGGIAITERIDTVEPSVVDVDSMKLSIAEDYSTYAEGFWWKIINGYPSYQVQLMFTLIEGANEVFLFKGSVYRRETTQQEYYLNGTDAVRGVSVTLLSLIQDFSAISTTALVATLKGHASAGTIAGGYVGEFISIRGIFATAMELAYGIPYDLSLVVGAESGVHTIPIYTETTMTYPSDAYSGHIIDCSVRVKSDTVNYCGFFLKGSIISWEDKYATAKELIRDLCLQFGLIIHYSFGTVDGLIDPTPANNTHRLKFDFRGHMASAYATPNGSIVESEFCADSQNIAQNIQASNPYDSTANVYDRQYTVSYWNRAKYYGIEGLPSDATFDLSINAMFSQYLANTYPQSRGLVALWKRTTGYSTFLYAAPTTMSWWNGTTKAYVNVTDNFSNNDALASYFFNRLAPARTQYTRTYDALTASNGTVNNSIRNMKTCALHQITAVINGAAVTKNYYATEVKKELTKNTATIVWVED